MVTQSTADFVKGWLASEGADHDSIKVKRAYIDINDCELIDGVLFSQIMYWHGRSREDGRPRLRIFKEGHLWLAKTNEDWWSECRIKYNTVRKALDRIESRGLIVMKVFKFNGTPTVHVRVAWESFESKLRTYLSEEKPKQQYTVNKEKRAETQSSSELPSRGKWNCPLGANELALSGQFFNRDSTHRSQNKKYGTAATTFPQHASSFLDQEKEQLPTVSNESKDPKPIPCGRVNNNALTQPEFLVQSKDQKDPAAAKISSPQENPTIPPPLKIGSDGWLSLPRDKNSSTAVKLASGIVARMLAVRYDYAEPLIGEEGDYRTIDRQVVFVDKSGDEVLEGDLFARDGNYSLRAIRSYANKQERHFSRKEFNNMLAKAYEVAVAWLAKNGGRFPTESIFLLFEDEF